jgi:thiol-disulfide isomerase/thioredoxin
MRSRIGTARFWCLLALLVVSVPRALAEGATRWTPAEFEASLFSSRGGSSEPPKPHLLQLYAPRCGHCKRMAKAFDETAVVLRAQGFEVGKVDCADEASEGAAFCARLGVKAFPSVKLFLKREDAFVDFPGSDRSTVALMTFAIAGHSTRPKHYYAVEETIVAAGEDETDDAVTEPRKQIKVLPKTGLERYTGALRDGIMDVIADVASCVRKHPLGSSTIFFLAFFVALVGIILTDLVSERLGVPRRGESWEDMRRRMDWELARESVVDRAQKKKKKASAATKTTTKRE